MTREARTLDDTSTPRPETALAALRFDVATRTRLSVAAGIGAILLVAALAALPLFAGRSLIQTLFTLLTLLALAQYWNLLAGFAGLVSIGQQAFVGLGGYILFYLAIRTGLDPVLSVLAAGVLSALVAIPTAFLVFRLRGPYFAIGTWVVAEVFRLSFAQVKSLGGGTGTSLPREVTGDTYLTGLVADLLGIRNAAARDVTAYWLALILAVATIGLVYVLLRSRQGLALSAIRDDEGAAGAVGVEAFRTKFFVYLVAAFGTGLTGALIYLQTARISPDAAFSVLDWTATVIFIVVIGGIGTIEGPIIGVLVLYLMRENLSDFGAWYMMLLGALAILVMLVFPRGIWGTLADRYGLSLFPITRRLVPRPTRSADEPLSGDRQ